MKKRAKLRNFNVELVVFMGFSCKIQENYMFLKKKPVVCMIVSLKLSKIYVYKFDYQYKKHRR